jgi:hypothetical protein
VSAPQEARATGGAVALPEELAKLEQLAARVRSAQERQRNAAEAVLAAQDILAIATADLAQAEAEFRDRCPIAFGLTPRVAANDPIDAWLADRCDLSQRTAATLSADLFHDFRDWLTASGRVDCNPAQWNAIRFGRHLSNRGIGSRKGWNGIKLRVGIRLIEREATHG